ncbi:MAG: hypothetical protein JWQ02_3894 [Capsulimonas sp.]|nr:hypothetical protein [Capsulimonas sp.]
MVTQNSEATLAVTAGEVSLAITLFGPMQAFVDGRPLPPLRSRKSRWLLALLVLRHGHSVERAWLCEMLWPDAFSDRSAANLNPVLSDLRQALGSQSGRVQSPSRHTLRLDLGSASVDLLEFDAAVASQKPEALERAAALYHGPLLEGCNEEWAVEERTARERECLKALGTLAENALAAGDHAATAEYYRRAIRVAPLWEAAQRGLMQALFQAGDDNAALSVYRTFAQVLRRDDPKAAPDEQTTARYTQGRAEARRRASLPAVVAPKSAPSPKPPGHLPKPLTDLIGREDERAEVIQRIGMSRLVTLTGPGGIGKTRLALTVAKESAPQFADGVWLAALETLSEGSEIVGQIASVLKLKEKPDQPLLESLIDYLRPKDILLVLDNCEHLLDTVSHETSRLLRECGGVRVLATSRESLRVTGEVAWQVPSLSAPDPAQLPPSPVAFRQALMGYGSAQLFVERAQAARKDFSLTEANAPAVAEICARLEGVPLAVELAAARVRAMTPEQIASRLDDHLSLLGNGSRAAMSRHQTMRATMDWSYTLLDTQEQILLGRLSVFSGGWTLEAAEAVCGGSDIGSNTVLDLLTSLVDKSLVTFGGQDTGENASRYRMLETVRQYGSERLQASEECERARARHWEWCLALAEESEPHLVDSTHSSRCLEMLGRLDTEYDNLRAALDWSAVLPEQAQDHLRMTSRLFHYWRLRGRHREGRQYLSEALNGDGAQTRTPIRGRALRGAALLAYQQNDYQKAQVFLEESISISKQWGDQPETARVLQILGHIAIVGSNLIAATAYLEERLSISRALEDRKGCAAALTALGSAALKGRDFAAARKYLEESLSIYRTLGVKSGVAQALGNLAHFASVHGDYATAMKLHEERLLLYRELDDRRGVATALNCLSFMLRPMGEYAKAHALSMESAQISRTLAQRRNLAISLIGLGSATYSLGSYEEAQTLFEESLGIALDLQDTHTLGWSYRGLGHAAYQRGDYPSAQEFHRQNLPIWRDLDDKNEIAETLNDLAIVLAAQTQIHKAARLWGAAEALRETIGMSLSICDLEMHHREVDRARTALGADAFATAWKSGQGFRWEQAVAYALEETAPVTPPPAASEQPS